MTSPHTKISPSVRWRQLQIFHWFMWITGILYVLWCYFASPANGNAPKLWPRAFVKGAYGLQRVQDDTNLSWNYGRSFLLSIWVWCLVQAAVSQALLQGNPRLRARLYPVFSALALAWTVCWECVFLVFAVYVTFFLLAGLRIRIVCYMVSLLALVYSFFTRKLDPMLLVEKRRGDMEYFLTSITVPWTVLRCLSFSVDFATDPESSKRRFPDFWMSLAYVFYLPSVCLGPLMNYDNFVAQLEQPPKPWTVGELVGGLMGLVRSAFHLVLRDLMNHYFYSSALIWMPRHVSSMDLSSLVGYGVCLNFMFYVKYLVFYGAPGALARLDRVRLPPPPTCVAREHLCSHFWRNFDNGLHLWIRRYIYQPLVGGGRPKLLRCVGTVACFGFVCVWHQMTRAVQIWCALNAFGISLEIVTTAIRGCRLCQRMEATYVHGFRLRVLKALLGSSLYLLTIFACLFFLTNMEVAIIFFHKVILGFPLPIVPVLMFLYFASHVSLDVMDWERVPREASHSRPLPSS
ncbi:protein-cysteine N-palmitoyltransferase HHAT [Ixodes scapularis]|uniref:protein-cysteine N-palmitoyltransferase HHAT n=1 Tax=Ixodes scapularis TaxID=6945 RepID=UPI001A9DB81A|nr:protein-cysteine N-palmitoyltransferase HHAT [Ixodes scapularis]